MSATIPPRPDIPLAETRPGQPRATWTWRMAVLIFVGVQLLGGVVVAVPVVAVIDDERVAALVASLFVSALGIGVYVWWLESSHPRWKQTIGWPRDPWPEVRWGLLFGIVLYPTIILVVAPAIALLLQAIFGRGVEAPEQLPSSMPAYAVIVSIVYATAIAPVHEELFFRGILFRALVDRYGSGVGAVGSGIAFGLIHYVPAPWLDALLLILVMVPTGIAFAWLYDRRGNLLAPIVAHATFNVIGLIAIYALG